MFRSTRVSPAHTKSLSSKPRKVRGSEIGKVYQGQQELLAALERVSRVLASEVELQKILAGMAKIIAVALGAKWVNFWELTPDKKGIYISAHHGMTQEYMEHSRLHPIPLGTAWIGRAVKTKKAWGTSNILTDPKLRSELGPTWQSAIKQEDYRALLCVPLLSGKEALGGMCVYFPLPHEFTDFEMRLMSVSANQAATAIKNSQIFGELNAERNKTIAVLNSLYDGIMVFDLENRITSFNPRAEELLWVRHSEAINKRPEELDIRANPLFGNVRNIAGLPLLDFESKEILLEKPTHFHLFITALPVKDAAGHLIGSMRVLHDITAEKETEELRSGFVAVASHQLRTPISGLKWALDMMSHGEYGSLTAKQNDVLRESLKTVEYLLKLIRDILDVSRIEKGHFGYAFSKTDLQKLVEDAVHDFDQEVKSSGVHLKTVFPGKPLPKIEADPEKLKMAITNIIDNALRYTPANGKVTISFLSENSSVILSIADTGIGIPKNQQKFLFTKFFRAENAVHFRPEGSGLGLWIANEIIKHHNGRIRAESEENKGSTLWIELPIEREDRAKGNIKNKKEDLPSGGPVI